MEVYNGGYCPIEFPEIIEGKYAKDFGTGFYCTELKEQAVCWSLRYDSPIVSTYNYESVSGLKILHFSDMNEEWLILS